MIADKQEGHKPVAAAEPEDTNVVDLMAALRASLSGKAKGPSSSKASAPSKAEKDAPRKTKARKAS